MKKKTKKSKPLQDLELTSYCIYGIIDRHTNKLVYVSLDQNSAEDELDFGEYDQDDFDLVSFNIMLG